VGKTRLSDYAKPCHPDLGFILKIAGTAGSLHTMTHGPERLSLLDYRQNLFVLLVSFLEYFARNAVKKTETIAVFKSRGLPGKDFYYIL
jgi:hypothetical protein